MSHTTPIDPQANIAALRAVFQDADKPTRRKLSRVLPPAVVEFAGVRLYVDPRDNYTDHRIWLDGQPPEMTSLMALVDLVEGRDAFVMDIGANCGAFAVPLGVAAGPGSRIVAIEPNPIMIGRLGHNIRLNDLGDVIRVEGCALGAERGEAVLNFRTRNFGQASLMPIRERVRDGGILVPVRPLTDFVAEAQEHEVAILKIDVEGGEVAALSPLLDSAGWLPEAMLVETKHKDEWEVDLVQRILDRGFAIVLKADGNTLFVREDKAAP